MKELLDYKQITFNLQKQEAKKQENYSNWNKINFIIAQRTVRMSLTLSERM